MNEKFEHRIFEIKECVTEDTIVLMRYTARNWFWDWTFRGIAIGNKETIKKILRAALLKCRNDHTYKIMIYPISPNGLLLKGSSRYVYLKGDEVMETSSPLNRDRLLPTLSDSNFEVVNELQK